MNIKIGDEYELKDPFYKKVRIIGINNGQHCFDFEILEGRMVTGSKIKFDSASLEFFTFRKAKLVVKKSHRLTQIFK